MVQAYLGFGEKKETTEDDAEFDAAVAEMSR
jgi:hypothetical protein